MMWTALELAQITQGELRADPELRITGISTDTRNIATGDAFVAIVGEQFDGADFAEAAMAGGAALVIAQRDVGVPCIVVRDAQQALGRIARAHLNGLPGTTVVAITGSSGKTSTKDLVAHVLQHAGPTVAAVGSFNNEIGLPRTVLTATPDTRFLVLEMGMRGLGHIAHLCEIAPPAVAAVLNIGTAHVGVVGSREGIANAKGEILEALRADGAAIINRDDQYAQLLRSKTTARIHEFGFDEGDVHASELELDELARASFLLHIGESAAPVRLQLIGEHQVPNALAAAAIAAACGMEVTTIAAALSTARAQSRWRMEAHELPNGVTVINDAYNANPESMRSALRALAIMGRHRRTWAVLGEMRELGTESMVEHDAIGRLAVRLDISQLVAIGDAGKIMQMGAAQEGSWGDEATHVATAAEAVEYVTSRWQPGDVVLVKASRSIGLERVAQALIDAGTRED